MATPKVFSGARATIKLDGEPFAFATDVEYEIVTDYKEIQSVDNSLPEELVPTKISVEVRCTSLRVPKKSASYLGLQPTILSHLDQRYVSLELRDRGTDEVILIVPKAMLVRRAGRVSTRQLASEVWTFRGIGFWDELEPKTAK